VWSCGEVWGKVEGVEESLENLVEKRFVVNLIGLRRNLNIEKLLW
jgi:hypothetical protein